MIFQVINQFNKSMIMLKNFMHMIYVKKKLPNIQYFMGYNMLKYLIDMMRHLSDFSPETDKLC